MNQVPECWFLLLIPIIVYNRYKFSSSLGLNSLMQKTLKPYFERYDWLFAITLFDVSLELLLNLSHAFAPKLIDSGALRVFHQIILHS